MIEQDEKVAVENQRSIRQPRLWLAGYGDWTGPGSATLMGAARTARDLAARLVDALASDRGSAPADASTTRQSA